MFKKRTAHLRDDYKGTSVGKELENFLAVSSGMVSDVVEKMRAGEQLTNTDMINYYLAKGEFYRSVQDIVPAQSLRGGTCCRYGLKSANAKQRARELSRC
tara:strand:- start:1283 stop:1582 length:300 start_codon:yes stop_codon:yes gene_type:complete